MDVDSLALSMYLDDYNEVEQRVHWEAIGDTVMTDCPETALAIHNNVCERDCRGGEGDLSHVCQFESGLNNGVCERGCTAGSHVASCEFAVFNTCPSIPSILAPPIAIPPLPVPPLPVPTIAVPSMPILTNNFLESQIDLHRQDANEPPTLTYNLPLPSSSPGDHVSNMHAIELEDLDNFGIQWERFFNDANAEWKLTQQHCFDYAEAHWHMQQHLDLDFSEDPEMDEE